ncbi:hypothetical protein Tco_1180802 [Tanacetum coccineum]
MTFEHLTKEVVVEVLAKRSIDDMEVLQVEVKEGESWMTPIHEYLLSGLLLEDPRESRKIIIKAPQYKLIKGNFYKKSFFTLWLPYIAPSKEGRNSSQKHMAIHPLGSQHSMTPTNGPGRFNVSSNSSRALYEIGRNKATNHYKREAGRKVRMGIQNMQVRGSMNNQLEGRKAFQGRHICRPLQRIKNRTILLPHHKTHRINELDREAVNSKSTRMGG